MAKVEKVHIHSAGARALLNSSEVKADLKGRADAIRDATGFVSDGTGPGYVSGIFEGKSRARAIVRTYKYMGARDNYKNQTLLKNLDRGR